MIKELVEADAADGLILVPNLTPGGLGEFADRVVPILQERGVFRTEYEGTTLRDHLGLTTPAPPSPPAPRAPPREVPADHAHPAVSRRTPVSRVPLTVLDLVPIPSGSDAATALRNSIDLARHAEEFGYARYWFAEHHLNPGLAGASPSVVLALTAAATSRIRIGSGAVQLGHRTALSTVEEFGLIDALHPGRLDLGLGRSAGRRSPSAADAGAATSAGAGAGARTGTGTEASADGTGADGTGAETSAGPAGRAPATVLDGRAANGLRIPQPFSPERFLRSPRFALQDRLLRQPGAQPPGYPEQIADVLALLRGTYRSADGVEAHAVPGEGARVQVWILGSSAGVSATVAGEAGLRFAASYHVSPATVLEAVAAYRSRFVPSAELTAPYVSVSADVVVAATEARASELASGYGPWVRSIRTAEGAIPFPTPEQARRHPWTEEDRALVADRVETQFVGTARQVAERLDQLRDATGADELIVTTITHDHADRVRSYELLAGEWTNR